MDLGLPCVAGVHSTHCGHKVLAHCLILLSLPWIVILAVGNLKYLVYERKVMELCIFTQIHDYEQRVQYI